MNRLWHVLLVVAGLYPHPAPAADANRVTGILPVKGVLDSPSFFPLRRAVLLPGDSREAERLVSSLADQVFNIKAGTFEESRLSVLYRDLIKLKPGVWRPTSPIPEAVFEQAKRKIVFDDGRTKKLTMRYESFRKADARATVDAAQFRALFAQSFGFNEPTIGPVEARKLLGDLAMNAFDLEVLNEGGLYTSAREIYDAYSNNTELGFWSTLQSRAGRLLDENISPNHILTPAPSELTASPQGWTRVRFLVAAQSLVSSSTPGTHAENEGLVEFDMAVVHIVRPWLDVRLLRYLRAVHAAPEELSVPLLALQEFPSRIHLSFVVGRRLRSIFVSRQQASTTSQEVTVHEPRSVKLLRDVAFSGIEPESMFVFGLLIDAGAVP
jgi:hypothetical protein